MLPIQRILNVITLIGLTMGAFLWSGCNNDNGLTPDPTLEDPLSFLSYDGRNQDAPLLPGATYEAAVRFPQSELQGFVGNKLVSVYYHIGNLPNSSTVLIYQGTFNNGPDSLVYSAATTSSLSQAAWNQHQLSTPVKINSGTDLWIGVRFSHPLDLQVMGCDTGPANPNGDYLYSSDDGEWRRLNDRAPQININWNIRGVVDPR